MNLGPIYKRESRSSTIKLRTTNNFFPQKIDVLGSQLNLLGPRPLQRGFVIKNRNALPSNSAKSCLHSRNGLHRRFGRLNSDKPTSRMSKMQKTNMAYFEDFHLFKNSGIPVHTNQPLGIESDTQLVSRYKTASNFYNPAASKQKNNIKNE